MIKYRTLHQYKYETLEKYTLPVPMPDAGNSREYVWIKDGVLNIKKRYAWDGATFPAINTLSFVRGSLVHDALYQLIETGELGAVWKEYADKLLYTICVEDGMWAFRAKYVYCAVRCFGGVRGSGLLKSLFMFWKSVR